MYNRKRLLVLLFFFPGICAAGQWYGEAAYTSFHYEDTPFRHIKELEEASGGDSFSVTGGFKFNRKFSLEVGYTDFHEYVSNYCYPSITSAIYGCGGYDTQDINGFHVDGVLGNKIGRFYPYFELGAFFPDGVAPVAGAGVLWDITPSVGINLYYEQFFGAIQRADDPKAGVQSYNLGFRYSFN